MTSCSLVWAHALHSSVAHEDELGLFDWQPVASVANLVRYDSRGHGTAEPHYQERACRWSALVDDMLFAAPQGPFVAGGIGMGAVTALYAALRARRRIQGLVLAQVPAAWQARQSESEALKTAAGLVETRGPTTYLESVGHTRRAGSLPEPAPGHVARRHMARTDLRALPAILRGAASSDLPTRDEIANLCVPTIILAVADDPAHPVDTAETLARSMVMSELVVSDGSGAMKEWPALIAGFVSSLCLFEHEDELPPV
jgi:3-oxoadipate enol-lactonase